MAGGSLGLYAAGRAVPQYGIRRVARHQVEGAGLLRLQLFTQAGPVRQVLLQNGYPAVKPVAQDACPRLFPRPPAEPPTVECGSALPVWPQQRNGAAAGAEVHRPRPASAVKKCASSTVSVQKRCSAETWISTRRPGAPRSVFIVVLHGVCSLLCRPCLRSSRRSRSYSN